MADAQIYSGIAQGLSGLSQELSTADLRRAQIAEAKNRQQLSSMQLQEAQASAPTRKREDELKLQQLEANAYSVNSQLTQAQTYDAFRRFNSDKDTRHLNSWLSNVKKNPIGANLYGDVVRVDPISKTTETDQLLRQMGFADVDGVYADPELSKDLVIFTGNDKRGIVNMNDLYAGTGFTNYLTNEELDTMAKKARISSAMRQGGSAGNVSLQERVAQSLVNEGRAGSLSEAYEIVKNMGSKDSKQMSSTEERVVAQIQADAQKSGKDVTTLEALDQYYSAKRQGTGETNESRFIKEYQANNPGATYEEAATEYSSKGRTNTQKEIKSADAVKDELDAINFLEKPISKLSTTEKAQVHRKIAAIEDLRGSKLTNEAKREIRTYRDLAAIGNVAGQELTPDQTGLLDSALGNFKKYISDEVGGVKATSSYEQFRNSFRHALYGAALTTGETANFNKAAGTLGQKFGPVMAQLQTQMVSIKHNLEAIRDLEDPYIAHYYTGQSIEEIDAAISAIDQRINLAKTLTSKKGSGDITVKEAKPEAVVPDVKGNVAPEFDFDASMKKYGL